MTDTTQKFTGKAAIYAKARPSYAAKALEYLASIGISKDSTIADIGCGTGIFSKQLLDLGTKVYGIEPNDDMQNIAKDFLSSYKNFHLIKAPAENTTLGNNSIDFISTAQSFHWFDPVLFKQECLRILKPNGKIILLWNSEIFGTPFFDDFGTVQSRFCPNKNPNTSSKHDPKEDFFKQAEAFFKKFDFKKFANNITYDKETFILKASSSSASPRPTDKNYAEYTKELENVFDKYQSNGKITYPNNTHLYIGSI